MSRFAAGLQKSEHCFVATRDRRVFKLIKVSSVLLAGQKLAKLVGADDVHEAVKAAIAQQDVELQALDERDLDDAERAARAAKRAQQDETLRKAKLAAVNERIEQSPKLAESLMSDLDKLFQAGVVAGGELRKDALPDWPDDPVDGQQRRTFRLVTSAEVLFTDPITFVDARADADDFDGMTEDQIDSFVANLERPVRVWLGLVPEHLRKAIAGAVMAHSSVIEEVLPFREESDSDADATQGGEGIRSIPA